MNYFILFLAIIFYLQNLIISFFINFAFVPQILEFMIILFLLLIISRLKYQKAILYIWQFLYFIHFCFISYFGTSITYIDIYLFFTHMKETIESFSHMFSIMLIATINFIFMILIITKVKIQKQNINPLIPLILLITSFFYLSKPHDASFILLNELRQIHKIDTNINITKSDKPLKPLYTRQINIVLVIGESMRAKEYLSEQYDFFENNPYKTIYSGATNTDVSIPLLLNGAKRPKEINLKNNLFYLAKNNGLQTHYITTQNNQYLKYIKPYLAKQYIDSVKILATQDDNDLTHQIKKIKLQKSNFIVLQMQGQHSPYTFYPNSNLTNSIQTHYKNSMKYSNTILKKVLSHLQKNSYYPYTFIFTSDHGQLLGENQKYGHNRFEKQIYKVPFVYQSTITFNIKNILNHNDIYNLIKYQLGYLEKLTFNKLPIKIYGTMINEEDGFIQIN